MSSRTIDISEATAALAQYAQDAKQGTVIVTSKGKPLAAVVDVHDIDQETLSLSMNPKFIAILERSRRRMAKEGAISADEMRRRLGVPRRRPRTQKRARRSKR